jgi:hypothetical protein
MRITYTSNVSIFHFFESASRIFRFRDPQKNGGRVNLTCAFLTLARESGDLWL